MSTVNSIQFKSIQLFISLHIEDIEQAIYNLQKDVVRVYIKSSVININYYNSLYLFLIIVQGYPLTM